MEFNRFDVSAKELIWDDPGAWLERFGIDPRAHIEVIDSDITTLTAAADKVIRVGAAEPYLVNIELHSYHETSLARTLWFRQVALDYRHNLPVLTVLVLLCKEANSPGLTGVYESRTTGRTPNESLQLSGTTALARKRGTVSDFRHWPGSACSLDRLIGSGVAWCDPTDGRPNQP